MIAANHFFDFIRQVALCCIQSNRALIAERLRRYFYKTDCFIDTDVFITNPKRFSAGPGSALYHGSYILNNNGMFSLGKNSHLGAYCYVNVCFGSVQIGDHVAVGPGTKIISYSNHYALGEKVTEKTITADIVIGNNVLIGANCTLLPGSRIHDNVVIGAGAVVKGELAANAIYGGIPCSRIKFLGHD